MQTSVPFQYTTTASTNLTNVSGASETAKLTGYAIVNNNAAAAPIFVKFYWSKQGEVPVVGTTIPDITVGIAGGTSPVFGGAYASYANAVGKMGQMWMWVTALAVPTDTTATGAGDGIITLFLQH